ncbi:MAG: 30S ribosomal protein S8 [Candidatus Colwellbacteria bacterium]|nr:30S ribosomal protein S8 [Candidatus Colwellbacteria bacterium]
MYWDTLVRIKNGLSRGAERVKVPYSKFDLAILEALVKANYLESVTRKGKGIKKFIDVRLKYGESGKTAITGIAFLSRPSRRLYQKSSNIRKSRQGYGHYILTTPKGILTGEEARRSKVGGQLLFEIW